VKADLVESFFELEDWHWWFEGRRHIILSELEEASAHGPVLDVGCGSGGTLAHLNGLGPGYGVDTSVEAVELCHKRSLEVALGSGFDLPYADDSFATVLALDVLEHVEDDVALLRELKRVLRDDGLLLLTVPALPVLWSAHDEANDHHRRYLRSTLEGALHEAGFEPERLSYYNSLLLPLACLRKLIQKGRGEDGAHLESLPGPLNAVLARVLSSEATLLRHTDLPIGASLISVCRPNGTSPVPPPPAK
jgi:SAM-dependent methyltransferase